jgi:hypothetical protein
MKKLLIIALILWGCDYAPTEHTHEADIDVYGCTNQYAENYLYGSNQTCKESIDSGAVCQDDGSCLFKINYKITQSCIELSLSYTTPSGIVFTDGSYDWQYSAHLMSTGLPDEFGCYAYETQDFLFLRDNILTTYISTKDNEEPPQDGIYPKFITFLADIPVDTIQTDVDFQHLQHMHINYLLPE